LLRLGVWVLDGGIWGLGLRKQWGGGVLGFGMGVGLFEEGFVGWPRVW
jgi:hypothetical protein